MTRNVLITGCSSGIGRALAQAFASHGDHVIATARRAESLNDLKALGCECLALDVNDETSRAALALALAAAGHKKIDILINNAGISAMGPMLEIPADKLRAQFETNVISPVLISQLLLPLLRASTGGIIVNIGSVSGILTTPFAGAYCASKAALHSISDAMRMELTPFGIQVVTVQPGAIQSNFGDAAAASINDWLSEDSLYAPIRDGIMARAGASQVNATPASEFAATLLAGLQGPTPSSLQKIGYGSHSLPLLQRCLPRKLLQKVLNKKFRLTASNL
ncbi:MAG: SDR family oxidoreductase [Oceanococcus sp.]